MHQPTSTLSLLSRYLSFSIDGLRFVDSLNFLGTKLSTLVDNLASEGMEHFKYLRSHFPKEEHQTLLARKQLLPYEWLTDESKLLQPNLPGKADFYSSLTREEISDEDMTHCQKVWDTFGLKTMDEYLELYLKCDILLTCDCFERFRSKSLCDYDLDPGNYLTLPALSWDAALLKSKAEIELLTSHNAMLFFERGVRGGLSSISKRFSRAENKFITEEADAQTLDSMQGSSKRNLEDKDMVGTPERKKTKSTHVESETTLLEQNTENAQNKDKTNTSPTFIVDLDANNLC